MQDYERKGGIHSKVNTKEFEDNFDRIFRAKEIEAEKLKKQREDGCPCTNADKDCKDEDYTRCCAE